MLINDFTKFVENWRLANINPKKKELQVFLNDRVKLIKQMQSSNKFDEAKQVKAIREQKFVNSIIDLDTEYGLFMDHVERKLNEALAQYADYINNGGKLREQNNFLKERLETMDKREMIYLELLKNRR